MGLKSNKSEEQNDTPPTQKVDEVNKMQKQAFEALDKEYEYARLTTHLNRGKQLNFLIFRSYFIEIFSRFIL